MTGSDWKMVASFENQIVSTHPAFDVKDSGKLRRNIPRTPCDLFLTIFPMAMALIEPSLPRYRAHAEQNDRRGLANLDIGRLYRFLALLLKMGSEGLRRREQYFVESASAPMSQRTFENLLYTIGDPLLYRYPNKDGWARG
jgi:hypothetical protein